MSIGDDIPYPSCEVELISASKLVNPTCIQKRQNMSLDESKNISPLRLELGDGDGLEEEIIATSG